MWPSVEAATKREDVLMSSSFSDLNSSFPALKLMILSLPPFSDSCIFKDLIPAYPFRCKFSRKYTCSFAVAIRRISPLEFDSICSSLRYLSNTCLGIKVREDTLVAPSNLISLTYSSSLIEKNSIPSSYYIT